MSLFITPADAKAIDKAFREYKDAEQALHKAFLYRRPMEEIGTTFGHSKKRTLLGLLCAKSSIRDDRA